MSEIAKVIGYIVLYFLGCFIFASAMITVATLWHFVVTRPTLRKYGARCPTEGFIASWGATLHKEPTE